MECISSERVYSFMAHKLKQDISIGDNLRKYRQAANMSQEQVAAKLQAQGLDISREIISQMELGKYSIRVSILLALSDLYKTIRIASYLHVFNGIHIFQKVRCAFLLGAL